MAILRFDPTRTTTLRKQYMADMARRFKAVRSLVVKAIWKQDALGLGKSKPLTFLEQKLISNALPGNQAWRFQTDAQKLASFKTWLQDQINQEILSVDIAGNPWSATYIESAYRKGVVRSFNEVNSLEQAPSLDFFQGSQSQFLESSFAQPERLSKLQFLYTRSFEELQGISNAMSQQLSRVLASGIANGKGPRAIARELSNTITGITKQRALVLARTEIIAAHAEGQLDAFEDLGIEKVGVLAEWSTAGDDRVCPLCGSLEGAIMTIKEARGLIPRHPNCRCAWIPANIADKKNRAFRSKTKKKIKESLKAELPKKTRAGDKVPQTVKEAKERSTWAGSELDNLSRRNNNGKKETQERIDGQESYHTHSGDGWFSEYMLAIRAYGTFN